MNSVVNRFKEYLQFERNYSDHTVKAYTADVELFFDSLYPQENIDHVLIGVSAKDIRMWMMDQMQEGQSARSVNRRLSSLRLFFRFVEFLGLRKGNPVVGIVRPKGSKKLPAFLRVAEVNKIMSIENFPDDWIGMRDRLMLLLLYSTGLRRSELALLCWRDYDTRRQVLHIHGKGEKDRLVPVTLELAGLLETYMKETSATWGDDSVQSTSTVLKSNSGQDVSGDFIYSRVNHYYAVLPTCSCRGPHALRHTFATHMLNGGADVLSIKELLGHRSIVSTQVYTHADVEQLMRAYRSAHPRASE